MHFFESPENCGTGKISPKGDLAALSKSLQVRLFALKDSLEYLTKWQVLDEVTKLEWSNDNTLILCAQFKRSIIQIFHSKNFSWTGLINNGICGIGNSLFCKDSRQVLTYTLHATSITIWNLVTENTFFIRFPKFMNKGLSFSSDGRTLSIILRENNNDVIGLYDTATWIKKNTIEPKRSLADIFYLPDNTGIVGWSDSVEYFFIVFDLCGNVISSYSPNFSCLGISEVKFTKSANYMSVCGFDKKIRVFHAVSWVKFQEFCYFSGICEENALIMKETENFKLSRIENREKVTLEGLLKESQKTLYCAWSDSNSLILTVLKSLSNILWIWENNFLSLKVLIVLKNPLQGYSWNKENLAWVCGSSSVYLWKNNSVQVFSQNISNLVSIQSNDDNFLIQSKSQAIYAKLIRNR